MQKEQITKTLAWVLGGILAIISSTFAYSAIDEFRYFSMRRLFDLDGIILLVGLFCITATIMALYGAWSYPTSTGKILLLITGYLTISVSLIFIAAIVVLISVFEAWNDFGNAFINQEVEMLGILLLVFVLPMIIASLAGTLLYLVHTAKQPTGQVEQANKNI